jgi:hydrogenase maturation protease
MRVLVSGVGNTLRCDDGFGVVAARKLEAMTWPEGVRVVETGISGMSLVYELMDGYDALIVMDIVDRGRPPGTIMLIEPDLADPASLTHDQKHSLTGNTHLATPSQVMLMAKSMGVLPTYALLVACQPLDAEGVGMELSPEVEKAVDVAVAEVRTQVDRLLAGESELRGPQPNGKHEH